MEGGTLGPAAWADPEPCGTVATLKEKRKRRWETGVVIAVVEGLDAAGLERIAEVHPRHTHSARTDGPATATSVPSIRSITVARRMPW